MSTIILNHAYNLSHPESRCAAREKKTDGRLKRHKFITVSRYPKSPGIFTIVDKCQFCGAEVHSIEDYNVLAGKL